MLHIIGDFYLTANKTCFILGKPLQRDAGRISMDEARYFTDLPTAVTAAVNLALRDKIQDERIQSLQEAVDEMERIRDEIHAAVSGRH